MPSHAGRNASFPGAAFDVVGIAASAGGVNVLVKLLAGIPADFPSAIVIVQHLDPRHSSLMAKILSRHSALPVKQAQDGDRLTSGAVFVAPPNQRLLMDPDGSLSLSQSELVHFVRHSADLLFESLAASYKEPAIAVVLTGSGRDGAMGVQAIDRVGGTVIAQDEDTSELYSMPSTAIDTGGVDFVLPLDEIASALVSLVVSEGGS